MIPIDRAARLTGAALAVAAVLQAAAPAPAGAGNRRHTRHRFVPFHSGAVGPRLASTSGGDLDPPEVAAGERLFLETRFAQFFAARAADVNRPLPTGDPILDDTPTTGAPLPGPFGGKSVSCRACHFVDELAGVPGGHANTYGDFARRSRVPLRDDGLVETPRNSPPLVNASLPRQGAFLLHFDGEFATTAELVKGTLLGRNFGWLPEEAASAARHVARVIREDDGKGELAAQFGGLPYRTLLAGTDPSIPPELSLPEALRLDVDRAGDDQILEAVARLTAAYVEALVFSQDEQGSFDGSPYDLFLSRNGLPRAPGPGESDADYSRRLANELDGLEQPLFVGGRDGAFGLHDQPYAFGRRELAGLKLFLAPGIDSRRSAGNCAACHPAPAFTDFSFHNTGASQEEYDALHGEGAFAALEVPGLAQRLANPEAWLPASPRHPRATGRFRSTPSRSRPGYTDLGLWNVYLNPDLPGPQAALERVLAPAALTPEQALRRTLGLFKTPGLRDLGHSAPYLHAGRMDTLEDVVRFYVSFSQKARLGRVRNAAPELARIFLLSDEDAASLVAFLRSLNEDYQ